ncbi:MAG: serine--tRNA ligase, partial [Acidimicrobiales bacterium]
MIDLRLVRDDPDRVRGSQRARGEDPATVDALLEADEQRRAAVATADDLRAEQKTLGRKVGQAGPDERSALLEHAKHFADEVKAAEAEQALADDVLRAAHQAVSNLIIDGVPPGGEDDFRLLETVGEPPAYDFEVVDHVEVGHRVGAFDTERGAKVSGARFYFLTGPGALLEIALLNLAIEQAVAAGFTPIVAPALVRPEAMEGTGFLGAHAEEVYRIERDDLYLVGTSEVPLAGY